MYEYVFFVWSRMDVWQPQQLCTSMIFLRPDRKKDVTGYALTWTERFLSRTILGELKWYGGCRYSRDRERNTLTISQHSFAEELVKEIRLTSVQSVPLGIGLKLEELEKDEETESWPFRELVGGLMWLAILIRPDPLRGTVPRRKPFIGKRHSAFLRTLAFFPGFALQIREGH